MERIYGALALIALVAVPFWFSKRKNSARRYPWDPSHDTGPTVGGGPDTEAFTATNESHSDTGGEH